jgi:hypothetical protein
VESAVIAILLDTPFSTRRHTAVTRRGKPTKDARGRATCSFSGAEKIYIGSLRTRDHRPQTPDPLPARPVALQSLHSVAIVMHPPLFRTFNFKCRAKREPRNLTETPERKQGEGFLIFIPYERALFIFKVHPLELFLLTLNQRLRWKWQLSQ